MPCPKTERRLWAAPTDHIRWELRDAIRQSERAAASGDAAYFASKMPPDQHWRLYPEFRGQAAFFDIETAGLDRHTDQITTIVVYDGAEIRTYVRGANLDDFPADIGQHKLLVTFCGSRFDVPFCEAQFPGLKFEQGHIDLYWVLKALGYSGGLKACEKALGLRRSPELADVDGSTAVKLWQRHLDGDQRALPALLRYNTEDVLNLPWVMETAYNLAAGRLPIGVPAVKVGEREAPRIDFDGTIIAELCEQARV